MLGNHSQTLNMALQNEIVESEMKNTDSETNYFVILEQNPLSSKTELIGSRKKRETKTREVKNEERVFQTQGGRMWQNKMKVDHEGTNCWFLQTDDNNDAPICSSEPLLMQG